MADDDTPQYLRLKDGTLIDTRTGERQVDSAINRAFSDQPKTSLLTTAKKAPKIDTTARRYIDDLPTPPAQSRAVALIAGYTLFGLCSTDIAYILNQPEDVIDQVLVSEPYAKFIDAMLQNIREHDKNVVRKKLNDAATKAAERITKLSASADEKVALAASRDILDRVSSDSGMGSGDGNRSNSSLTIRIIDDRDNAANNIEVEFDG